MTTRYNVICHGGEGKKTSANCLGRHWDRLGASDGFIDIRACEPCAEKKRKKKEELSRGALYNKLKGTK